MVSDFDELDMHSNGDTLPPVLRSGASPDEMVRAINGLAVELQLMRESLRDDHQRTDVELQLMRESVHESGTRIETFCQRVERALNAQQARDTDPAPAGEKS
jgi:hypothetical protein